MAKQSRKKSVQRKHFLSVEQYFAYVFGLLAFVPTIALAQGSIQSFSGRIITFLNVTFIPFLFSLALLFFIFFVIKYFIIDATNQIDRGKAGKYALYSISAFVVMVSLWGIVNLFIGGLGFGREEPVCPDVIGKYLSKGCDSISVNGPPERLAPAASPIPADRPAPSLSPTGSVNTTAPTTAQTANKAALIVEIRAEVESLIESGRLDTSSNVGQHVGSAISTLESSNAVETQRLTLEYFEVIGVSDNLIARYKAYLDDLEGS